MVEKPSIAVYDDDLNCDTGPPLKYLQTQAQKNKSSIKGQVLQIARQDTVGPF
jgi:hypothetical protein